MYRYTCEADDTCWQEKPPDKLQSGEKRRIVMKKPRRSRAKTDVPSHEAHSDPPESGELDDNHLMPPLALFIAPVPFAEHFATASLK